MKNIINNTIEQANDFYQYSDKIGLAVMSLFMCVGYFYCMVQIALINEPLCFFSLISSFFYAGLLGRCLGSLINPFEK